MRGQSTDRQPRCAEVHIAAGECRLAHSSRWVTRAVLMAGLVLVWLLSAAPARAGEPVPERAPMVPGTGALRPTPDPVPGAAVMRRVATLVPVVSPVALGDGPVARANVAVAGSSGQRPAVPAPGPDLVSHSTPRPRPPAAHRSRVRAVSGPAVDETPMVRATLAALTTALAPISRLIGAMAWASPSAQPGWVLLGGALLLFVLSAASLATLRLVVRLGRG